jgi:hypothetical protein
VDIARVVSHQITGAWLSIILGRHIYCALLHFQASTTRFAAWTSGFPVANLTVNWARHDLAVLDLHSVTLDRLSTISSFNFYHALT